MHRRLAAAATLCLAVLLAACTDKAPQPPPPPSAVPSMPSPSSTRSSSAASPSPDAAKHADLLQIQELYKAELADENRVLEAGGATQLPRSIKERTSGPYQKSILKTFRDTKRKGIRLVVSGKLLGISMGSWTPTHATFQACEDYSGVRTVGRDGKPTKRKPGARGIEKIFMVKDGGSWRINDSRATIVKDFGTAPCRGTWYQ